MPPVLFIAMWMPFKWNGIDEVVAYELREQYKGLVREEPLSVVRSYCRTISQVAKRNDVDLIVPIRWPHITVDHRAHYIAHFICYAGPQLDPNMRPVYLAGYDRRTWIVEQYRAPIDEKILFVGGDPVAWQEVMKIDRAIVDVSTEGFQLHIKQWKTGSVQEFLERNGLSRRF